MSADNITVNITESLSTVTVNITESLSTVTVTVATVANWDDITGRPTIPDELSDLISDSTHRIVTDAEKLTWNGKISSISTLTNTDIIGLLKGTGLKIAQAVAITDYLTVGKLGNEATISTDEVDMSTFGEDIFYVRIKAPNASNYVWSTYLPQLSNDATPTWRNRLLYLVNDSYEDSRQVDITIFKNTFDAGSRIHVVGGTKMLNQFDLPPGAAVLLWSHYSQSINGSDKWAWHVLNANITIPAS